MTALQCDICGGQLEMDKSGAFAVCKSCGLSHSADRLKQKVQEIKGIVSIDGSVQVEGVANVENLLVRAQRFFDEQNYSMATEYCNKVLDIDADNNTAQIILNEIKLIKVKKKKKKILYKIV